MGMFQSSHKQTKKSYVVNAIIAFILLLSGIDVVAFLANSGNNIQLHLLFIFLFQ